MLKSVFPFLILSSAVEFHPDNQCIIERRIHDLRTGLMIGFRLLIYDQLPNGTGCCMYQVRIMFVQSSSNSSYNLTTIKNKHLHNLIYADHDNTNENVKGSGRGSIKRKNKVPKLVRKSRVNSYLPV